MKVLIIGNTVPSGLPMSFLRAFRELGHDPSIFDDVKYHEQQRFFEKRSRVGRFLQSILTGPLQKRVVEEVGNVRPDLVLVVKGMLLKPETIVEIKKNFPGVSVCNFNPDNPFNTWHRGSSNARIRASIPVYDAYCIWGRFLIQELVDANARRVIYVPFGYDPEVHRPVRVSEEERNIYGSDLVFIGSWDREREELLERFLPWDIRIWGNGWERASRGIRERWQGKPVFGENFSRVCNASGIVLNLVRKQNMPAHNMRTFEVPACGGFMITTRTKEQQGFFEEGREAEYFSSADELIGKVRLYLGDEAKRREIASLGHARLLGSGYSYTERVRDLLREL